MVADQHPDEPVKPQRLWQWLLMFPGIILPLYTALPVWIDKGLASYKQYNSGSAKEAEEQISLASQNMNCLAAPYNYYESVEKLKLDGTICKSGDILIRAVDSNLGSALYFLPSRILKSKIAQS